MGLGLRVRRENGWGYQGEKGWDRGRHWVTTQVEFREGSGVVGSREGERERELLTA